MKNKILIGIFLAISLTGCLSRKEIQASIWLNNAPIPVELCEEKPELKQYGFYRRLNDGKLEFISFCDPSAHKWLAMYETDFNRILDELIPRRRGLQSRE